MSHSPRETRCIAISKKKIYNLNFRIYFNLTHQKFHDSALRQRQSPTREIFDEIDPGEEKVIASVRANHANY